MVTTHHVAVSVVCVEENQRAMDIKGGLLMGVTPLCGGVEHESNRNWWECDRGTKKSHHSIIGIEGKYL